MFSTDQQKSNLISNLKEISYNIQRQLHQEYNWGVRTKMKHSIELGLTGTYVQKKIQ